MSLYALKRVTGSEIAYPRPCGKYVLLFHTWSQFRSWFAIVAIVTFAIQGLMVAANANILPARGYCSEWAWVALFRVPCRARPSDLWRAGAIEKSSAYVLIGSNKSSLLNARAD